MRPVPDPAPRLAPDVGDDYDPKNVQSSEGHIYSHPQGTKWSKKNMVTRGLAKLFRIFCKTYLIWFSSSIETEERGVEGGQAPPVTHQFYLILGDSRRFSEILGDSRLLVGGFGDIKTFKK